MNARNTMTFPIVRALLVALMVTFMFVGMSISAAKVPQIEVNHMRVDKKDVVLSHAIAWQEARGARWVTVVLLTDRPIPRESITPDASAGDIAKAAKATGIAFVIGSGGVPLSDEAIKVFRPDGTQFREANLTGSGGFEITLQSATQIKGRASNHPLAIKKADKEEDAWLINFDAPVLRGDSKRMQADGEALGPAGGQPGMDLQIRLKAMRSMDYAALLGYASTELADYLKDPAKRDGALKQLRAMTPPEGRIVGASRKGDKALLYWKNIWPDLHDQYCVEALSLKDGKWRSESSNCQAE